MREMTGIYALMASLLYGSDLRLMECVRLRVKDIDFAQRQLMVRDGKGAQDRVTVLPEKYRETLARHLEQVKKQHDTDLAHGHGAVYLWPSLERTSPNIAREWGWQYMSPAKKLSIDPRSGQMRRHISTRGRSRKQLRLRCRRLDSPSRQAVIPCGIRSPRIYSSEAMTFARCKNSWGMQMFRRP